VYLIWPSLRTRKPRKHASPVLQVSLNKRRERQLPLLSIYVRFPKLHVVDRINFSAFRIKTLPLNDLSRFRSVSKSHPAGRRDEPQLAVVRWQ
jgi:hypothetical protein